MRFAAPQTHNLEAKMRFATHVSMDTLRVSIRGTCIRGHAARVQSC